MILCLLTQLSKQTHFIQKRHYELQREVLIDRRNTKYKNIHQSDTTQQTFQRRFNVVFRFI